MSDILLFKPESNETTQRPLELTVVFLIIVPFFLIEIVAPGLPVPDNWLSVDGTVCIRIVLLVWVYGRSTLGDSAALTFIPTAGKSEVLSSIKVWLTPFKTLSSRVVLTIAVPNRKNRLWFLPLVTISYTNVSGTALPVV